MDAVGGTPSDSKKRYLRLDAGEEDYLSPPLSRGRPSGCASRCVYWVGLVRNSGLRSVTGGASLDMSARW